MLGKAVFMLTSPVYRHLFVVQNACYLATFGVWKLAARIHIQYRKQKLLTYFQPNKSFKLTSIQNVQSLHIFPGNLFWGGSTQRPKNVSFPMLAENGPTSNNILHKLCAFAFNLCKWNTLAHLNTTYVSINSFINFGHKLMPNKRTWCKQFRRSLNSIPFSVRHSGTHITITTASVITYESQFALVHLTPRGISPQHHTTKSRDFHQKRKGTLLAKRVSYITKLEKKTKKGRT